MTDKVFGVDLTKPVTPHKVRDAIAECFFQAHCIDTELEGADDEVNREYCNTLVKKAFADAKANFESPTKEGIVEAMNNLAEMSKNFRNQATIQKHYDSVMQLVNKL